MTSSSTYTRSSSRHAVFGHPNSLPVNQLPTKEDIFKCYLWHRSQIHETSLQNQSKRDIAKVVAADVIGIWEKAIFLCISQYFHNVNNLRPLDTSLP